MNNGSFMAFRRLKQLVPEFDAFVATTANDLGAWTQSFSVRDWWVSWKSGAPVSLTPSAR